MDTNQKAQLGSIYNPLALAVPLNAWNYDDDLPCRMYCCVDINSVSHWLWAIEVTQNEKDEMVPVNPVFEDEFDGAQAIWPGSYMTSNIGGKTYALVLTPHTTD